MSATDFMVMFRQGDKYRLAAGIAGFNGQMSDGDVGKIARELKIDRSLVEDLLHAGEVVVKCSPFFKDGIPDLRPSHYYAAWNWGKYLTNWEALAEVLEECAVEGITARDLSSILEINFGARPNRRDYISRDLIPSQIKRRLDDLYSLFERALIDAPAREKARGLLKDLSRLI
jgi:hypothetical protein